MQKVRLVKYLHNLAISATSGRQRVGQPGGSVLSGALTIPTYRCWRSSVSSALLVEFLRLLWYSVSCSFFLDLEPVAFRVLTGSFLLDD
jgi:hypothetical protein